MQDAGCRTGLLTAYGLLLTAVVVAHAETVRDPFTFGPRQGTAEAPATVLIAVLWNAPELLAIVGNQMVGLGDQVDGWQIVKIQEDGIVIQRGDRRETVPIGNRLPTE